MAISETGGRPEMGQVPEKTPEKRTLRDIGRERVAKTAEMQKNIFHSLRERLSAARNWVKERAADLIYVAVGGAEYGVEKTAEGAVTGKKAVEAGVRTGIRMTAETAKTTKEVAVDSAYITAALGMIAAEKGLDLAKSAKNYGLDTAKSAAALAEYFKDRSLEASSKAGRAVLEAAVASWQSGVDFATKTGMNALAKSALLIEAGVDLVKAAKNATVEKVTDIYASTEQMAFNIAEKGREAYNRARGAISSAVDSFNKWWNYKRMTNERIQSLEAGNRELLRNLLELREQFAAARPETPPASSKELFA